MPIEKGIFIKEEFLGMMRVVHRGMRRKRKENNRRRLFL